MAIPDFQTLMLPVLKQFAAPAPSGAPVIFVLRWPPNSRSPQMRLRNVSRVACRPISVIGLRGQSVILDGR